MNNSDDVISDSDIINAPLKELDIPINLIYHFKRLYSDTVNSIIVGADGAIQATKNNYASFSNIMNYIYGNNKFCYRKNENNSISVAVFLVVNCDVFPDYRELYSDWYSNRYRKYIYTSNGVGVDVSSNDKKLKYISDLFGDWKNCDVYGANMINTLIDKYLNDFINQENF